MPVWSVNGLKKAASSAAVQLPPQVLTKIVRVCAIDRSVMMSGPTDAAVAAAATPLRNVRRRMVILRGPSRLDGGRDSIAGSAGIAALRGPDGNSSCQNLANRGWIGCTSSPQQT